MVFLGENLALAGASLQPGVIIPENRWVALGLLITHKLEFCLRLETLMYSVFLHLVTPVVISAMWSVVSQVQYSLVRD